MSPDTLTLASCYVSGVGLATVPLSWALSQIRPAEEPPPRCAECRYSAIGRLIAACPVHRRIEGAGGRKGRTIPPARRTA